MNTSIKIGLIGAGYWGKNLLRNFYELGVNLVICDTDAENLKALQDKFPQYQITLSVNDIFKNPQITAVVIATPAETHGELVQLALQAKKDVFVEKPLCLDLEQGRRLVDLAKKNRRILMVGHLLWYHPAILKLKQLIAKGELGRIQYIYSNRLNLGKIRQSENILWSFAPHDISVILGLLNESPEHIQILGGNYLHSKIADVTVSLLSFSSGVKAHIFVSWLHPFKEQKLVVVGNQKMAVFDDTLPRNKLMLYPHAIRWENQIPIAEKAQASVVALPELEPLREECSHFIECLTTRNTPRTDGDEGLRVLEILQKCQEGLSSDVIIPAKPSTPKLEHVFIHKTAEIDEGVEIGQGTRIWHFSHVLLGSKIGTNCRIGQNVVIGPRVKIGNGVKIQNNIGVFEGITLEDSVFCGPSVVFTNVTNPRSEIKRMGEHKKTLVRRGATLGANSTILCGLEIGRYAFIGAGSVVTKNVPDYALVIGNPGRIRGWMCSCGTKLKFKNTKSSCSNCAKYYQLKGEKVEADESEKKPSLTDAYSITGSESPA